jgi:hypothetical protein
VFKRAYCRGITTALVQSGHAAFPSDEMAAKVADYIADNIEGVDLNAAIPADETAKIATHVIDASNSFKQRGQQPGPTAKVASVEDLQKHAHLHAVDLMEKAAEGSNYTGGDKGPVVATSAEGKADEKDRPDSYAANARGDILHNVPAAAHVGVEEKQPAEPHNHPDGTNSLTEASKSGSLNELMKKIAITVPVPPGGKDPRISAESKAEEKDRPKEYARLPHQGALGEMMKLIGAEATVGKEMKQPSMPHHAVPGTNSLTETSKISAEDPYIALFKKVAQEVHPHLPAGLTDDQKVAHIRSVMGLTTQEKAHYLTGLQKQAAEKVSGEVPPQFAEHMHKKDDGEKKDEKKDEGDKKDEAKHDLPDFMKKKEGAAKQAAADDDLAARLRAITQSVATTS